MKSASREERTTSLTVELECLQCRARACVELSADKFKLLGTEWKIAQECGACGELTNWSFAKALSEIEGEPDFWDWLATTGEVFESRKAAVEDDRRSEPRVEFHVPLRIVAPDGAEDQVTSENISKSGLCFVSLKTYQPGERIIVKCEPPGGGPAQTLNATIVRSAAAAAEGKTLYGARIEK